MNAFFMGVDLGGTVIKAGIYTAEGQEITVAEHSFPTESPQAGFSERNMEMLWEAACSVIRQAIQNSQLNAAQISGVSFSSHGKGLYLLNSQGKPVRNGIVSSDSRAQSIVDEWHQNGTADKATIEFAAIMGFSSRGTTALAKNNTSLIIIAILNMF